MDKGKKRKRDSTIPILRYSAPGYPRFAKLFTETSLDEIKEIVRNRLELPSISDFTLFYDTDIALVNDDDFDAFEVHAHSSSSAVDVVVKILSAAPPPNAAGPSVVEKSSDSAPVNGAAAPARKKRKVDAATPAKSTVSAPKSKAKPISSAPEPKKQKPNGNATIVNGESNSTALTSPKAASTDLKAPGGKESKKKRKQGDTVAAPSAGSSGDASGANPVPEPPQERPPKRSKKNVEKDPADAPEQPAAEVPSTEIPIPPLVEADRPKAKSKKNSDPAPPKSKASTSKATKKSKKDDKSEDAPSTNEPAPNKGKSVTFTGLEQPNDAFSPPREDVAAESVSVTSRHKSQDPEKGKRPKGKRKAVEQDAQDVAEATPDPESIKQFWNGFAKNHPVAAPEPEPEPPSDQTTKPPAAKGTKKTAAGSRTRKQTAAKDDAPTVCPVCQTAPTHLRYRCPVVLAGSARIEGRIAELQQDASVDHSKLIQELHGLAEKSRKTGEANGPKNVNAHSQHLRADAKKGGVSDPPVAIPGRKLAASGSGPEEDESGSSSDDSESTSLRTRKKAPAPIDPYMDAELAAIIRGPVSSRLTVDDVLLEEDQEDNEEAADSVVLENDEDDDLNFRRRSRQMAAAAGSSGEDDDDDDEQNFLAGEGGEPKAPPVVNISGRVDSRRSSARSPTEPPGSFFAIDSRHSVDFDLAGGMAVGDAMASDNAMFGSDVPVLTDEGSTADTVIDLPPQPTQTPILLTPKSAPKRTPEPRSTSVIRLHSPEAADPIQPAEDFPPTPAKGTQAVTPSTPRVVQRMKDRHGKTPVRLSQLAPPFSLSELIPTQPAESAQDEQAAADQQVVDDAVARTRTRSSTRLSFAAALAALPIPLPQPEQPAKRRRGPNKTEEQRAQEAAAKLAAKEEKERLRNEKAQAKAAKAPGKKGTQPVKSVTDTQDCPPTTPPPQDVTSSLDGIAEISKTAPQPSHTPGSQHEWTVLRATSPREEENREYDSMRDELRSSSLPSNDGLDRAGRPPLFLPAESQIPFPYSQWNSVPDEFSPGSPKESEDEDDEEEVAASIKSLQRPVNLSASSYRRLTDIASQSMASLFSRTPSSRDANFPSSTFPSAKPKDQRAELYGKLPQDDESTDSDSSADNVPSHIPKSRRAGMTAR